MGKAMESGALAQNHTLYMATDEGSDINMGKFTKKRDERPIDLCDVYKRRRNHRSPPTEM